MSKQSRLRLVIAHTLHVLALAIAFAVSLVASLLLNVNLPATRRFVATAVTFALKDLFEGRLIIERIDGIGLDGARGVRVRVLDDTGAQVILADGVNANAWVLGIVKSVLLGSGEMEIPISHVYADWADVSLDYQGDSMRIAGAFVPKPSTKPPSPGPSRGVKVTVSQIALQHVWVHGAVPKVPPLDVDANDIRAHLDVTADSKPSDAVAIHVGHIHLLSRNAPYHGDLDGDAHAALTIPIGTDVKLAIGGTYRGAIAGIPAKIKGGIDGDKVDAVVDVPRVEVDRVQKILPGLPLADLASAHAEVHGKLDALDATARAQFGTGVLSAKAKITTKPEVKIDGTFVIEHMDARAFVKTAPETDASATGKATLALKPAGISGDYEIDIAKGSVAKTPTPSAHIKGKLQPTTIMAAVSVDEPGVPTTANATLDLKKNLVVFDAHALASSLTNIPQLKGMLKGGADVRSHGTVDLGKSKIDADYEVVVHHFETSGITADEIETNGHVRGPLASPTIDVAAHARVVGGAGIAIESVHANAMIDVGSTVTVRDAVVDVSTQEEHIQLHADRVLTEGGIKVEGATVDGLGQLIGVDAQEANGLLALSVHAHDIDLAKVSRVLGTTGVIRSGRISVNADVKLTREEARGNVAVDITRADVGPVSKGRAHVDAQLLGKGVIANVHLEAAQFGRIDVNTSTIHLAGSPLTPRAWTEATGDAQIDGELQLANFATFLPPETISTLQGAAIIDGEIKRDDPKVAPSVEIDVDTSNLVVAHAPDWRIDGIDLSVVAKLDGKGNADVTAKVHDKIGDILAIDATSQLPIDELIALAPTRTSLTHAPSTIDIEVPNRKFSDFPAIVGFQGIKGQLQASVKANGTFLAPNLSAVARVANFRSDTVPLKLATSGEASVTYDGSVVDVKANIEAKKQTVLAVDAQASVLWKDALQYRTSPKDLPWTASAHAVMTALPLQAVTPLSDRGIRGNLSGEVAIKDLHKDAHATVQLAFDDLKVGKAKYTNCYVRGSLDNSQATGFFRIDQTDGYAEASASAGTSWGLQIAPTIDASKNVVATVNAKNLSAAVMQPFLDSYLNQLDGRIDANVKAIIPPTGEPSVQGTLAVRQGVVQSPIVGEEFDDVEVHATVAPSGNDTVIQADKITALGTTGKILASASARLHGVDFVGANVVAQIPKGQPVQLTVSGQDYGEGYGNLSVQVAVPKPSDMTVKVVIPSFHVRIPQLSTRTLQGLDPATDVRVGVKPNGREFLPLAIGPAVEATPPTKGRLDVDVQMGKDVDVQVGDIVRAQLTGGPHITVTDAAVVTGQIRLTDGTLDVQGKQFEIQEGGTVTFNGGEAGNPDVVVSALWPAPDGTRVYADFNGPLKTGKVTLHSEPAKSQNDILALILFGSADESGASGSQSGGTQAASTAGGFATQGLSKAIGDLTGIDAQVKIDTSEANNPKPEVQVQITRTISIELATVLGIPPFGDNPDTNFVTLDWRFYPRWSLATTFGNKGTSILDLLWQYRY